MTFDEHRHAAKNCIDWASALLSAQGFALVVATGFYVAGWATRTVLALVIVWLVMVARHAAERRARFHLDSMGDHVRELAEAVRRGDA